MDLLPTAINAAVVAGIGLLLGFFVKGRFDEVNRRFEGMNARMDGFQRSLDAMRSDLTNVALAVGARREAEAGGQGG